MTTSRPSRVTEPVAVAAVQVVAGVEAVEVDDDTVARERVDDSRTSVDRAQPGVGDEDDGVGRDASASATVSPSSARGERTPPAPSTNMHAASSGTAARPTSVGDRERRPSERVGGHRRRHRHREPAVRRAHRVRLSPVAAASTSASVFGVVRRERLRGLAGAHRTAAGAERARGRGGDPRLADVGAGAGDEDDHRVGTRRRGRRRARLRARPICSSVCAAESVTRSRDVPGATVGGRIAGTSSRGRAARRPRRARVLRRRRRTGRSATGGPAAAGRRARAGGATSASPSATAQDASAASAAAVSAGVGAVVKMYGRAVFTTSST